MRLISVTTKNELVATLAKRYAVGKREEKSQILDQFVSISGMHRKHAMRLLRGADRQPQSQRRALIYDEVTRSALIVLWEASDRICGKRLKPLLPILISSMEQHGHLKLDDKVRTLSLQMSVATIDRALKSVRETAGGRRRRRSVASSALKRSIPFENSPTGVIPHLALSRPIWCRTPVPTHATALFKLLSLRILRLVGPNARRCLFANRCS